MTNPLVPPLLAIVAGLLAARVFDFTLVEAAWPVGAFVVLAILAMRAKSRARPWLGRTCLILALAFTGVFATVWHRPGPKPVIEAGPRELVTLSGCVVEPSVLAPGRERFTLELDPGARARVSLAIDEPAGRADSPGDPLTPLHYGQRVEVDARVRRPHNFQNPGAFDYESYLGRQNIFWTANVPRGAHPRVLPGRCGSRWRAAIFAIREAALARIEALYSGDEYATGMMEGLLLGETSRLERVWTDNFRRTGTFHALVISGAHVAVLAGVLLLFLRLCAIPELSAIAFTAVVAWLYALVSGLSPPVARAAAGFTLYLAARFFFRRPRALNLAAAFAIVYLLWMPDELLDASFQLSFLSVIVIAALAVPLIDATFGPLAMATQSITDAGRDPHLIPRAAQFRVELRLAAEAIHYWTRISRKWAAVWLALLLRVTFFALELAAISAVIQIGLALPMAEYFHRISLTGVTANLMVTPLLELAIPAGFLAIFTGWKWVAETSLLLLKLASNAADWHARIEPLWRIADPPLWLGVAFVTALVVLTLVIRNRKWRWPAGVAALALFALLLWQPWPPALVPRTLELSAIDVGQGDSLLVVFPEGRTMLIDGGGVLTYGRARSVNLDTGEDVVSPYLWTRGIRHLDIVAATHAHADHTGGLAAIMRNFRPGELWVGTNPLPELISEAQQLGIRVKDMRAGQPFDYAGTRIEVLSPPPEYIAKAAGNNDSLALRIQFGERSFLLAGDMERRMEINLLSDPDLHADVLKVGHHGSKTSTTQAFLDAVAPSVGVISAGFENSFGHPNPDVLARLKGRHTAVLRTDLDGLITVRTDGRKLWWDSDLWRKASPADSFFRSFNWTLASRQ